MSGRADFTKEDLAWSSLGGIGRGVFVHSLIYPLEVIKIRQQCSQGESKSFRIAMALLRQEGIGAFYKGLAPQLLKTSIKQVWCWPMITGMPSVLQRYQIGNLRQQVIIGLLIATIDAAISTPLERAKIVSAFRGTSKFCLKNAYTGRDSKIGRCREDALNLSQAKPALKQINLKSLSMQAGLKCSGCSTSAEPIFESRGVYSDGWRGFTTHWSKLSVNWVAFLTAQKYLRDRSSGPSKQCLSFPELTKIGVEVALIVSLASAPFDVANTLKQAQNLPPSHLFSRRGVFKLYRGWPLNALSLVIHNIASVVLIEKLCHARAGYR